MALDETRLQSALATIRESRAWSPGTIDAFVALLRDGPDADLYRVNPYRFAERHGLPPEECVELFLHATRTELFSADWGLVCRGCGELVEHHERLDELDDHFFCGACAATRTANLDEQVEVAFTVNPSLRAIAHHDLSRLPLRDRLIHFRFSPNIRVRGREEKLTEFIEERVLLAGRFTPDEVQVVEFDVTEGWVVGSPRAMITVSSDGEPANGAVQELSLTYRFGEWLPRPTVAPGRVRVTLTNATDETIDALLYHTPIVTYFDYDRFVSGHRLLNDAVFRRYLRTEVVRPGSGMPINDNTLLFTDLRGSTELWDRLGDEEAFKVVAHHFECLAQVVTRWSGVVVKTMGDAIMASFMRPSDAVGAAMAMLDEIARLPVLGDDEPHTLVPKIGVHRGPCIAVNVSDNVDYFGHTVNVAARIQGQAGPGEICLSEAIHNEPQVRDAITDRQVSVEDVQLRGVNDLQRLYRINAP